MKILIFCLTGYKSLGRWRVKCGKNNKWNHSSFSMCITCELDHSDLVDSSVNQQSAFQKNLAVKSFFCPRSTDTFSFYNKDYKKGGNHKRVKCVCKKGQNGDPAWKNSCSWKFGRKPFNKSHWESMVCNPKA